MAGDLGPAVKIEQAQLFPQFDVVERLEIEFGRRVLAAADFQIGRVVHAARRVGVRQIGYRLQNGVRFARQRFDLGRERRRRVAELAAMFFQLVALGGVFSLADRLADFVGVAVGFF